MLAPGLVGARGYGARMKHVVKVRMLPTEVEAATLGATLRACNAAASWLSTGMHEQRVRGKFEAQKRFYAELKSQFGLSAQPAIRVNRQSRRRPHHAESQHRRRQLRTTRLTEAQDGGGQTD